MRHPAAVLSTFSPTELVGKRYLLLGNNDYLLSVFRAQMSRLCTYTDSESVDEVDVRSSKLYLRDKLLSSPLPWDRPLVWIDQADLLLSQIGFPEDLPRSPHCVVLVSPNKDVYVPASFIPVLIEMKGVALQDFVRWLMAAKRLNGEKDVISFLSSEFRENLSELDKLLDHMALEVHPRTVLSLRDLDATGVEGWDSTAVIHSMVKNDETKVLTEIVKALDTFHPKGIITILTRRVNMLMQVAHANVTANGQPEASEIKPWVWRQNAELVKEIPLRRLAQWAVTLDRTYAQLSRGAVSYRWTLLNAMVEMTRSV